MYLIRTTCGQEMAHEIELVAEGLALMHANHCVEALLTDSYCTATVYAPGEREE